MRDRDAPQLWRFGKVVLDERGPVSVAGTAVALDRSGFGILLALLRHAGEVVTKDELLDAGWPGRIVGENALNKAISRLRHALVNDGEAIRAVYSYGYRLAAPVRAQPVDDGTTFDDALLSHGAERLQPGDPIPHRRQWRVERRLEKGSASILVLARDDAGEARVFKFAFGETGLRGLRREMALSRYLESATDGIAGIAPLLGWNLTEPPFFVETPYYPDGDLRTWSERDGRLASLPQPARVELCAQLCETVAALHAAGIVHKDLKPDNLYLLADARAPHGWRLLLGDLGAGEAALPVQMAEFGLTRSLIGGPADASPSGGGLPYLAPELMAGQAATQHSDVFALGVLLYQLLAGDLRRPLLPGWEADVGEDLLREDIALATAIRPEQRLIDAQGLVQRLRTLDQRRAKHEAGLREAARQRQRDAQMQRLRQRWRWGLTLSIGLAAGLVAALWMYLRAEDARALAQRNQQRAEAVQSFLTADLLSKADPYNTANRDISVRQAIDQAAGSVETRFADQPDSAIAVYRSIADVYSGWGEYARAADMLRQARSHSAKLGKSATTLAEIDLDLCEELRMAGDIRSAEAACTAAQAGFQAAGTWSDETQVASAKLMYENGLCAQAVEALDPVVARTSARNKPRLLADALWFRALCLRKLARFEEAGESFERLIALQRKDRGENHPMTAWALTDYGDFLVDVGRFDEAGRVLDLAQAIFDGTLGPQHPDSLGPGYSRAEMHLWDGEWTQAIGLLQPRLQRWRETLGPRHLWTLYTATGLAWARAEAGMAQAAGTLLDETRPATVAVLHGYPAKLAYFRARWVRTLLALDRNAEATEELQALDAALLTHYAADHPWRAGARCLHARLALRGGDKDGARSHLAACRTGLLRHLPANHPALREPASLLAMADAPDHHSANP